MSHKIFYESLMGHKFIYLFLIIVSCSVLADSYGYQASWDANTEPDLSHYDLYVWSGTDSLGSPFADSTSTNLYTEYFVKSVIGTNTNFLSVADGKSYIQAALSAVDSTGNKSMIAVSNIIKAVDGEAPGQPKMFEISK